MVSFDSTGLDWVAIICLFVKTVAPTGYGQGGGETSRNGPIGRLTGYARVSTEDQGTVPQLDELRAAGCETVLEEHASGADRSRPVLARLLRDIRSGETLLVVRLDRLARSVSHLLAVIEQLEANGAHFRSLRDPIDTTTPQGMFSLQVLGAVAQLERALIAERTKAGLKAWRSRGRVGGNPGLRNGGPEAIRKVRAARDTARLDGGIAQLDSLRLPADGLNGTRDGYRRRAGGPSLRPSARLWSAAG
jgi:DNA invertase Pin-like site-specific DNA recombinase